MIRLVTNESRRDPATALRAENDGAEFILSFESDFEHVHIVLDAAGLEFLRTALDCISDGPNRLTIFEDPS